MQVTVPPRGTKLLSPQRKLWVTRRFYLGAPSGAARSRHGAQLRQFRLPHCLQHQITHAAHSPRSSIPAVELPRWDCAQSRHAGARRGRHGKPRPHPRGSPAGYGVVRRGTNLEGELQPMGARNRSPVCPGRKATARSASAHLNSIGSSSTSPISPPTTPRIRLSKSSPRCCRPQTSLLSRTAYLHNLCRP